MSDKEIKKEKYFEKPHETICWRCWNAVPSMYTGAGCPYSIWLKPVPGWEAKKCYKKDTGVSYDVYDCPMFVEDTTNYEKRKKSGRKFKNIEENDQNL